MAALRPHVFLGQHYQVAPHAALMRHTPAEVYETAPRDAKPIRDAELASALTVRGRRRVRTDGTVDVGGVTFDPPGALLDALLRRGPHGNGGAR